MERRYGHLYTKFFGIGAASFCFLLLLSALGLLPVGAQPQSPADVNRDELFEPRVESFFRTLRGGNSTLAFDTLLQGSPLIGTPEASAQLIALQKRVDDSQDQFGNIFHWERLEIKRVGTNIALVRYILLYDNYPVIWTFTFYRKPSLTTSTTVSSSNLWVIIELHFDTEMKNLL